MREQPLVLLIDDDEVHREMVHRLLDDQYEFHDAETGQQTLELLDGTGDYYCALLDNRLPDYTGIELLPYLRQRRVPVVMMSALITPELAEQARAGGCALVLSKDDLCAARLAAAIGDAVTRRAVG